jgi:sugar phosphate isomerase/epimerase
VHRIGVCSWSLRPTGPENLVERLRACGIATVQLALDPIRDGRWDEAHTIEILHNAGIEIASGMMGMKGEDYSTLDSIRRTGGVRSDEFWSENLEAAGANAELARRLDIGLVTFHAGFLPHEASDPLRAVMLERLRDVADEFGHRGVRVALETGQESAETLLGVLTELRGVSGVEGVAHVGVNFDPANMILYGMGDPVQALRQLADHVAQIHIKDAVPTGEPGTWGEEVPAGTGAVDWDAFIGVMRDTLPTVALMIEREAREDRVNDIRTAAAMLRSMLGAAARIVEPRP